MLKSSRLSYVLEETMSFVMDKFKSKKYVSNNNFVGFLLADLVTHQRPLSVCTPQYTEF